MVQQFNAATPADDVVRAIGDQVKGSVILVTGVSPGGLGHHFVRAVAKGGPSLMILTGRTVSKPREVADEITVAHPDVATRILELDLGSLAAVRRAAEMVNAWDDVPGIDVLVTNAGLMATPYGTTADGFETQFGTNHLGHFLFVNLVMPKVLASKLRRVVSVSSDGHRLSPMRWDDINFDGGKEYNGWRAYGQSKTANMLFALSLAHKLGSKGLTAVSLHPGAIAGTSLGAHLDFSVDFGDLAALDRSVGLKSGWADKFDLKEPEQGVATYVYGSYCPDLKERNGVYLQDSRIADPYKDVVKPWATSPIEADRLWKLSEEMVKQEFKY